MSKQLKTPGASTPPSPAERRQQKLEAALKSNLKRRKDQARTRAAAPSDANPADDH